MAKNIFTSRPEDVRSHVAQMRQDNATIDSIGEWLGEQRIRTQLYKRHAGLSLLWL